MQKCDIIKHLRLHPLNSVLLQAHRHLIQRRNGFARTMTATLLAVKSRWRRGKIRKLSRQVSASDRLPGPGPATQHMGIHEQMPIILMKKRRHQFPIEPICLSWGPMRYPPPCAVIFDRRQRLDFGGGVGIPYTTTGSDAPGVNSSSRKRDPSPNQDAEETFEIRFKTAKRD